MFAPDEHARASAEDHQHFPDEQRQEHQPVVDSNEFIASQSEQNGENQNGTGDHEAPKRTRVRRVFCSSKTHAGLQDWM